MSARHVSTIPRLLAATIALALLSFTGHQTLGFQDVEADAAGDVAGEAAATTADVTFDDSATNDAAAGEVTTEARPDIISTVFMIEHGDAQEIVVLISQLLRWEDGTIAFAVDQRTNSILYRGPEDNLLGDITDLIRVLDSEIPEAVRQRETQQRTQQVNQPKDPYYYSGGAKKPSAYWGYSSGGPATGSSGVPTDSEMQKDIDSKSSRYTVAARNAESLASRFRARMAAEKVDTGQLAGARGEVVAAVTAAFELRQQLQQTQLDRFDLRIRKLRRAIENRERLKDRIIARRVDQLTTGNESLESPPARATPPATAPGRALPGTPAQTTPRTTPPGSTVGPGTIPGAPGATPPATAAPGQLANPGTIPTGPGLVPATPGIPAVGSSELQVFLVSLVHSGNPEQKQAWLLDRATQTQAVVKPGSVFVLGGERTTVIDIERDHVQVRRGDDLKRWRLGTNIHGGVDSSNASSSKSTKRVVTIPVPTPEVTEQMALRNVDPDRALQTVRGLIGPGGVALELIPETGAVIVRGAKPDVEKVRTILGLMLNARDSATLPPPQSVPTVPDNGGVGGLMKSPAEFFESLRRAVQDVNNWQQHYNEARAYQKANPNSGDTKTIDEARNELALHQHRLTLIQDSYKAQIRLLEIDLEQANAERDAAARATKAIKELVETGVAPVAQMREAEAAFLKADADLQRAKALYDVYRRAGEPLPEPPVEEDATIEDDADAGGAAAAPADPNSSETDESQR